MNNNKNKNMFDKITIRKNVVNVKQPTLAYLKCDHTGSLHTVLRLQAPHMEFEDTPHDVWNMHDIVICEISHLHDILS